MKPVRKGGIMLVKILIRRRFKEGKTKEVLALLNQFRTGAMGQPGYVSGETLVDPLDPLKLLVIGTWQSLEQWEAWREHPTRQNFESVLEIYQEGPTEYETWFLGAPVK